MQERGVGILAINVYLAEAADKVKDISNIVSSIKAQMNKCKLTKFKSVEECVEFYIVFFTNSTPEGFNEIAFNDWFEVYNQLFSQPQFKANLIFYLSLYKPNRYDGLFKPLLMEITREAAEARDKLVYYSDVKAKLTQLRADFAGVCQAAMSQSVSQEPVQFCKAIDGALSDMIVAVSRAQENKLLERDNGDGIRKVIRPYPMREDAEEVIDEDVQEARDFVALLESFDLDLVMNEDVADKLSDIKDSAEYHALVAEDRAIHGAEKVSRAIGTFDRKVSSWIDKFRNYRKEKKIKAMLGETHHVMREILRITGAIVASAVAPAGTSKLFRALIGIVIYFCSWWITGKTNQADLRKFIQMVEDELEIVDKKIEQAERAGDDKGVVQLMRLRQKLKHQHDDLMRKAYPITRNTIRSGS